MNLKNENFIHSDLTYAIIGAAMEVHNTLGPGFLEAVYQEALDLEFRNRQIKFLPQVMMNVYYKGQKLKKTYTADFVVADSIIVEIKAVDKLSELEEIQVRNYLKATCFELGLLINFGGSNLEWKRSICSELARKKDLQKPLAHSQKLSDKTGGS